MRLLHNAALRVPFEASYQNRLRLIGRRLDLASYGGVNLLEVPGGFLARAIKPGSRLPEALEFTDDDFLALNEAAHAARGEHDRPIRKHPLLPTGYEDFLRALGFHLDQQGAEAITVSELAGFVAVGGLARHDLYDRADIAPFQLLLRGEEIRVMLDEAFRRRSHEVKRAFRFAWANAS